MHTHPLIALGIVFALTVGGCGGGGGESPPPTPTAQAPIDPNLAVPVQTAFANVLNAGIDKPFIISGWIDESTGVNPIPPTPLTGSGRLTIGPGVSGTFVGGPFDGKTVFRGAQVVTGTLVKNGQSTSIGTTGEVYYYANNYTTLVTDFPGAYTVYDAYTYPQIVKAGDTGSLRTGRQYASFADSLQPEAPFFHPLLVTGAYTVSSDSTTTLLIRIIETANNTLIAGIPIQTQTIYRIDTSGNASLVSITSLKYGSGRIYQTIVYTF